VAAVALEKSQRFEKIKPVGDRYRDLSGLFKLLEKFEVFDESDKRAAGHDEEDNIETWRLSIFVYKSYFYRM